MRFLVATASIALLVAVVGCAETDDGQREATQSPQPRSEQALLYSAALRQMVLVDSPFAKTSPPVGPVYVVEGSASSSAELAIGVDGPPFDADLKNQIVEQSEDLPPIEFVSEPGQRVDTGGSGPTGAENEGVVVGLAPYQRQDDGSVHLGVGLWCGIDCGIGLTYVLTESDGTWAVTGTTGPVTIS